MNTFIFPFITWLAGIIIILLFLFIISRNNLWFRKYGVTLFFVFWFLSFTVYFGGYFLGDGAGENSFFHAFSSLFSAIFSSSRIMAMELDLKEIGLLAEYEIYQALCSTTVFSAILLLGTTLLSNIGGSIIGRIRLLFLEIIGTRRNIYLIYGLSRETAYLISDIRRCDVKATILILQSRSESGEEEQQREMWQNDAFQYGASKVFISSERPLAFLTRVAGKCRKHTCVILMNPVRWKNTSMLQSFCSSTDSRKMEGIHFYVLYDRQKSERIARIKELQGWDIHWISKEELSARQMLMSPSFLDVFPSADCRNGYIGRRLRLAVIGYSGTAEELVCYLASCIQTAGMEICIDWFDEEIDSKTACFRIGRPELFKAVSLALLEEKAGSMEFYRYFMENGHRPDGIFLVQEEGRENADLAFRLREVLGQRENIPIFARMDSVHEDQDALKAAAIHSFGCMEQICSYDVLIGGKLDVMAKAVHCYYENYYGKIGDTESFWKEADLYEKRSSRAHAINIPWKLKCAGFRMTEGMQDNVFEKELAANPQLLHNLSVGEHLRWEASLFQEGWRTARPEDLPPEQSRDLENKLHVCLVPWEELAQAEDYYGIDYRGLDKRLVEALPDIVGKAGCRIRKEGEENAAGE
ncbi:MAG: hypothetical protein NC341_06465 [Blautia sp.]|nr:hypothetical protein [Blautia sp.]MCM1200991.1 hypothetical protein [Bacteroides fragilis]